MAQHDYNIANKSGADFRADLNNALLAIATVNSGSTEPSTTFAHQLWVDTSSSVLKIRNAADNAWITTGVSITTSNTFTGNLTGNVTGNLTGNVTGNVTGDLTGNADTATTLATARTISLSGDVAGSASFDGSGDITISTTAQIDSIALGTDTTGDYVQSISGGTGVTITGGTGEGSTPSVAIGQAVATTDNVTFNLVTATDEFIGDIDGAVRFGAKADEALTKGDVIYITGVSGNTPTIAKAKADDASKMPAFGIALQTVNANAPLQIVTLGTIESLDTSNESVGEILYVSTTAGEYTTTIPTGETSQIQNIGKVLRSHAVNGSIRVGGAGRSNATPNLNNGKIFIGNASNQSVTATLDTSIVVENTNLYYTTTRANTDFDTRLATKDTGDLTEGSNLYYTTARVNSDFDTRLATKDTGDLAEGSNLYYTDARVNSAFDTRLATKDTDDLTEGTTNLYYTSGRANTDFDTRLATKSTTDLAEGTNLYYTSARFDSAFTSKDTDDLSEGTTNLYYTTARFDSAFGNKTTADLTENTNLYYTDTRANSAIDARVTKAFVDALGIQASSVDANSVTLGTDTVGNYVATVTGTANKITVSGSGSESANITLSLPDDVQIADSLTVAGNLTVNGTLTSLDTTNLDIEDNLFQLNAGLTGSPVNDSGMLINRGTADNSIFMWDESVDKFTLGLTTADGSATGNITLNSLGTLVANLEGNVTGNVTGTVSSLSNHDTDDLAEGTNLYYTQARFDSALAAKSTSDLSEGSNLYYTDARFDTRLATKDTDDVAEGLTNLYYTTARFDSAFGGKSTSDLSEGTNLYYTDARVQAVSINNVVEDTTPQLGGNLDLNSSDITGTGDINITGTIQSSGNITGTLATAAQPNITSVGTLTGFTSTGIDDNATSTAMTLDSSGRVVIGTTSILTDTRFALHEGNVDLEFSLDNAVANTARIFAFDRGTSTHKNLQLRANQTEFYSGSTPAMTLDATGNVGIGLTNQANKLQVDGDICIGKATTSADLKSTLKMRGANGSNELQVFDLVNDGENGRVDFKYNRAGGAAQTIMSFGATVGNVGIGNSSPQQRLTVGAGSGSELISIYAGTGSASGIHFTDTNTSGDDFQGFVTYDHTADALRFGTAEEERVRIDASGGIGFDGTDTGSYGKFTFYQSSNTNGGGISVIDSGLARTGRLWTDGNRVYLSSGATGTGDLVLNEGGGNVAIGHTTTTGSKFAICDGANSQIQFFPEISTDTNLTQHYDPTAAVYINSETRAASHAWKIGTSESMLIDSNGNIAINGASASNFSGYVTLDLRDTTGGLIDFSEASAGVYARIQAVVNNSLNILNRQAYPLILGTNDTERMRIKADGQITTQGDILPAGDVIMANGRGISFAASSNAGGMTSELLDDYEEGTFTATVGSSSNMSSLSFVSARYVKVGKLVHFEFEVSGGFTSSGTESYFSISLPFLLATTTPDAVGMFAFFKST